ncbi:MAG: F0F1 ATP synthase subunit epsilon [Sulfuritalea sp.]|nr:F0F1 ATP synthase subunit epsilon [Sulfuritalea sp.]
MDKTPPLLQVDVIDVGRLIYSGPCQRITAPAAWGEVCILPRHAPLLTALQPGEIRLQNSTGEERFFYVSGGFMEVKDSAVSILADQALRTSEIDQQRAEEAREEAEQVLRETHLLEDRDIAKLQLAKAIAQLRVLEHYRHIKGFKQI